MKLTTKARYAVMAMVDLAAECDGSPVTLADIAQRQELSLPYLEQLFCKLRRHGLVKSVRGPGGGYRLGREAGAVRISDIVLAVDEPIRATRCNPDSGRTCRSDGARCRTHDLWDALGIQIYQFLASVTLADVVERRPFGLRPVGGRAVPPLPRARCPKAAPLLRVPALDSVMSGAGTPEAEVEQP